MAQGLLAQVVVDLLKVHMSAIKTAVSISPEAGIDVIAEHFEEAGVDDPEFRQCLDWWWQKRKELDKRPRKAE